MAASKKPKLSKATRFTIYIFFPDVSIHTPSSASANDMLKSTTIPVGQVLYAAPRRYSIRESDK